MIGKIAVCDVCGEHASESNPVQMRVSRICERRTELHMPSFMRMMYGGAEPVEEHLDVCNDCAGPFVAMMKEYGERKKRASRERQAPKPTLFTDTLAIVDDPLVVGVKKIRIKKERRS